LNGYQRFGSGRPPGGIDFGFSGRPPNDVIALIAVIFITYALKEFVPLLEFLRLTPLVWLDFFLWQLGTYAFVGYGPPSIWILLELLMIFWFGRDVYRYLGRRNFWRLLAWAVGSASVAAVATQLVMTYLLGFPLSGAEFVILQGQRTLIAIFIAGFATAYANATIMFFFVLPMKARWFLWLEIAIAFIAFLQTRDFAGFVGISTAVGMTYFMLSGRGPRRWLREWRLRIERKFLEARLERMRRKRGFRVIPGEKKDDRRGDPWVN